MGAARKLYWPNLEIERPPLCVPRRRRSPLRLWTPPYSGITFHASSTSTSGGLTNLASGSFALGSSLPTFTTGDVYVLCFGINDPSGSLNTVTAPAGWTAVTNSPVTVTSGTSFSIAIYLYYSTQSSPSTTWTYTQNAAGKPNDNSWVCFTMSGCNTTTPVDSNPAAGGTSTGSATATISTWNTSNNNALPIVAAVDWNGSSSFTSTGYTGVTTANNASCEVTMFHKNSAISPAGATGNITVTDGAGASGNGIAAIAFALNPAASAAAPWGWQTESPDRPGDRLIWTPY